MITHFKREIPIENGKTIEIILYQEKENGAFIVEAIEWVPRSPRRRGGSQIYNSKFSSKQAAEECLENLVKTWNLDSDL